MCPLYFVLFFSLTINLGFALTSNQLVWVVAPLAFPIRYRIYCITPSCVCYTHNRVIGKKYTSSSSLLLFVKLVRLRFTNVLKLVLTFQQLLLTDLKVQTNPTGTPDTDICDISAIALSGSTSRDSPTPRKKVETRVKCQFRSKITNPLPELTSAVPLFLYPVNLYHHPEIHTLESRNRTFGRGLEMHAGGPNF